MTSKRDSHGRFKADRSNRTLAIGTATAIGAIATGLASAIHFGLFDRFFAARDGHAAPDLEGDRHPGPDSRAPDHFRPDPTAPVSAADREALRPATGPAPGFAADRGGVRSQPD
ncbi:hypothetical protein F1C10_08050 [Sphingomonas sp. NBWT7]|uniref:hypothetical protein n=1 Tax=Sphingomonas sp. NBWT7 TaxID=2596913 RepID=UPI0016271449|nr:hypothetical protein [Sphingomonas sp. NBWT7]QNE31889.1 hypothetical protein F1C10_08050 [Sphingomonas sp. NBWT7]